MLPFRIILCPTDFSQASHDAVKAAAELAEHFGSELWFIHAVTPVPVMAAGTEAPPIDLILTDLEREESAKKSLEEIVTRFESAGLKTRLTVLKGEPAEEILRTAGEGHADLIVTSTHGHTGLTHLVFGSVAEKVVRLSPCPVLVIRSDPEVMEECTDSGTVTNERPRRQEADTVREGLAGDGRAPMERLEGELKETYDKALFRMKETKEKAQEKILKKKRVYVEKAEAEVKEWAATVELLKAKANKSRTEVKARYLKDIELLQGMQEDAIQKLQELKGSGDEAWTDLKGGLDRALGELKQSVKNAISRFRETQ